MFLHHTRECTTYLWVTLFGSTLSKASLIGIRGMLSPLLSLPVFFSPKELAKDSAGFIQVLYTMGGEHTAIIRHAPASLSGRSNSFSDRAILYLGRAISYLGSVISYLGRFILGDLTSQI